MTDLKKETLMNNPKPTFPRVVLAVLAVLAVLVGLSAFALRAHEPAQATAEDRKMPEACRKMMERHEEMRDRQQEMDAELDRLVETMQAARGDAKLEATAAVVAELVDQRKAMHRSMMGMCAGMMEHTSSHMDPAQGEQRGMKSCPMMKTMMGGAESDHADDSDSR